VVASVLSSNADLPVPKNICLSAEVGLSGEIRPVNRIEQRISEAEKLGFEKIIISSFNKGITQKNHTIELIMCSRIDEVLKALFS
jgi:DNA repair protein RadA/Sms